MIRTLLFSSVLLCFAHSVLFSQTDATNAPAAQNAAEQQAPATNTSPQLAAAPVAPAQTQTTAKTPKGFVLEDGTPVRLKTGRSISSADAHVGDTLDFEVLEDVRVAGLLVIPKGGIAFATVTEAQSKRRMARGGKLNVNIDSVRLITHEKAALRAVKEVKGGWSHWCNDRGNRRYEHCIFPCCSVFLVHAWQGHHHSQGNRNHGLRERRCAARPRQIRSRPGTSCGSTKLNYPADRITRTKYRGAGGGFFDPRCRRH